MHGTDPRLQPLHHIRGNPLRPEPHTFEGYARRVLHLGKLHDSGHEVLPEGVPWPLDDCEALDFGVWVKIGMIDEGGEVRSWIGNVESQLLPRIIDLGLRRPDLPYTVEGYCSTRPR
jgi:hypothetical protein